MNCQKKDCGGVGAWRPVVRFFAPAPCDGFFTMEMGLSLCAECKRTTTLADLVTSELEMIATAALKKMLPNAPAPDLERTVLEWMPVAESNLPPVESSAAGGGPVAGYVLITEPSDAEAIAAARKAFGDSLQVVAPAAANLADLDAAWSTIRDRGTYLCADCGGKFIYPLLGGPNVALLVFRFGDDGARKILLHAGCWSRRCTRSA